MLAQGVSPGSGSGEGTESRRDDTNRATFPCYQPQKAKRSKGEPLLPEIKKTHLAVRAHLLFAYLLLVERRQRRLHRGIHLQHRIQIRQLQ